jgi:hypothetical protein
MVSKRPYLNKKGEGTDVGAGSPWPSVGTQNIKLKE